MTFKVGPGSDKPGPLIAQGRQLNLKSAFAGAGALAEYFKNQRSPVNDLAFPIPFQIPLLHRRQLTIDYNDNNVFGLNDVFKPGNGSAAKISAWNHFGNTDDLGLFDHQFDGIGKTDAFFQ